MADCKMAEFGRVAVPADCVTAGPVACRHGADIKGHTNPVAGVEAGAAYLRKFPPWTKVSRAHLGVGLKTSCRQHDAPGLDLDRAPIVFHAHALDAIVVGN